MKTCSPSLQRGVSLIFSLITLVAMSLAAVALIRSVDTGTTILGNLSFKQDALRASDQATNSAIVWLSNNITNTAVMNGTIATTGYYATDPGVINTVGVTGGAVTRINWANNACGSGFTGTCLTPFAEIALDDNLPSSARSGVKAKYLIIRLCNAADPNAASTQCARPTSSAGTSAEKGINLDRRIGNATSSQYFRILVRTESGRKAAAYTETLVHF